MDRNLLYKFFKGKTTLEEECLIKQWLESSKENERKFLCEREFYDVVLLSNNEESETSLGKKNKIYTIVREVLKIAAVVVLTLFVSQYFIVGTDDESYQTMFVPVGQRMNVTLPDGTNVWLNASTTLTYPTSFKGKERRVQLDGEAYFKVAKNAKKPFVVEAGNYRIKALGTEFNVLFYKKDSCFETMLSQGKVAIYSDNNLNPVLLDPSYKAYSEKGKALRVEAVSDMNVYKWKDGLLCFKNLSFENIMINFERYYGQRIVIENENVGKYLYTGKFRQTDGLDYALRVLQKDISFNYEREEEKGVIYIK